MKISKPFEIKQLNSKKPPVKEGVSKETFEKSLSENENTTCQTLWDATKEVMREKFIVLNAYIIKSKSLKSVILAPISRT